MLDDSLVILTVILESLTLLNVFLEFNKNSNYHDHFYSKLLEMQMSFWLWTNLMFFFGYIVETTDYVGIPYIWLMGFPTIATIIALRRDYRYDLLMIDSLKYESLS